MNTLYLCYQVFIRCHSCQTSTESVNDSGSVPAHGRHAGLLKTSTARRVFTNDILEGTSRASLASIPDTQRRFYPAASRAEPLYQHSRILS